MCSFITPVCSSFSSTDLIRPHHISTPRQTVHKNPQIHTFHVHTHKHIHTLFSTLHTHRSVVYTHERIAFIERGPAGHFLYVLACMCFFYFFYEYLYYYVFLCAHSLDSVSILIENIKSHAKKISGNALFVFTGTISPSESPL